MQTQKNLQKQITLAQTPSESNVSLAGSSLKVENGVAVLRAAEVKPNDMRAK